MKSLQQHISEKLVICHQQVDEKLVINKNYKDYDDHLYHPETPDELRKIIKDRYDKLGPGTKQNPIDFNDIDVSKLKTFVSYNNRGIFEKTKFEYIDVSDWDVSNVKIMSYAFYKCDYLKSVGDLSKWNVSNVEYVHSMFCDCNNLKSVGDLSKWDVSNVENMFRMFVGCKEEIIPDWYKK